MTSAAGTVYTPAVSTNPRAAEIRAHEDMHRAQFAARGQQPVGRRNQLETEARRGAQLALAGRRIEPRYAAEPSEVLAYEHASAGNHLNRFEGWLVVNTFYDVAGIDWAVEVDAMLASDRIYAVNDEMLAPELSNRFRYRLLLEIFHQELTEAIYGEIERPAAEPPSGDLIAPTIEALEDVLFYDYLPTLSAADFAAADVSAVSEAFLEHWLDRLTPLEFVPSDFDLEAFRPSERGEAVDRRREEILDTFMAEEVQDLMFRFMLDEYARAVAGPHAEVRGAPPILGGGEIRTITPERWLETLDMEAYRERLIDHLTELFNAHLGRDRTFRRVLLTASDESSRFASLSLVFHAAQSQEADLNMAINGLRTKSVGDLNQFENDLLSNPQDTFRRLSAAVAATSDFFRSIRPDRDNDEALLRVIDAMIDALDQPGDYEPFAALVRLLQLAGNYRMLINRQQERARERISELIDISYEDVAAGIEQMAHFAATWINDIWIPKLHEIALRRITANVEILRNRRENWPTYTRETAAKLTAAATIFDDLANGLREGSYDRIQLEGQILEAADAQRLEDAARIMRAEAAALTDPETASERFEKLEEALGGFADVKARIESGEEDPAHYGVEVFNEARQELGLRTFPEFTTYADVIFGRTVARENPFLARLVIGWRSLEAIDDSLRAISILAALGFITVASLLVGALGTVAFWVTFAIDAMLSIGLGVHEVSEAEALLQLVRLDLDQSVTGVSEEDAELALTMAWIGLALSILLTVGVVALAAALRFARGTMEAAGLSLRYYQLARDNPELFNSLRRIVRDPMQLDRMLRAADDAADLERLLHRLGSGLDLPRVERLLDRVGDAGRVNRMLDLATNGVQLEAALNQLNTVVPNAIVRMELLDLAGNDVVALVRVLGYIDDPLEAQFLLATVPDTPRLARMLELAGDLNTLNRLMRHVDDPSRLHGLLESAGSGRRLAQVLELSQETAGVSDDVLIALARLEPDALRMLGSASARDLGDIAYLTATDVRAMNGLFREYGTAVLGHVQHAPYADVAALEGALRRSTMRVTEPVAGLYEGIAAPAVGRPSGAPSGWSSTILRSGTEWETTATSPTGGRLLLSREWDPATGELTMGMAFGHRGLGAVPTTPALISGRGTTPAMTYFSLEQMRAMGIPYGAAARAGGIQRVKMSQIENIETIAHLHWLEQRYPGRAAGELIRHTHSYEYAETILTQSGYRITRVEVSGGHTARISGLTGHYERAAAARELFGETSAQRHAVHSDILRRYGFARETEMYQDFNIYLYVEPI